MMSRSVWHMQIIQNFKWIPFVIILSLHVTLFAGDSCRRIFIARILMSYVHLFWSFFWPPYKTYKVALDMINRQAVTVGRGEYIATLKEAKIGPDDYLRFRLSQRFDKIAQSLYDAHKKEAQSENRQGYLASLHEQIQKFQAIKDETGSAEEAKLVMLADQIGVNVKKATTEEKKMMLSFISRSKFAKLFKKRK